MTTPAEAKKMYENKFFYKIVRESDHLKLYGPLDNIYFCEPQQKKSTEESYRYFEVTDGTPVQAFYENQILVTEKLL